ncbi:nuclease A inhibitor family protein [Spirosoma aerophilum]
MPISSGEEPKDTLLSEQLTPLLTDLFYPSESDEPIEPVTCYLKQPEPLIVSQIKDWLMLPPSIYVEETPENDFWQPVVQDEDWFTDEEKARTTKFRVVKELLEKELTVRQVFKVGESEIDVYLLGRQADGQRTGLKTRIIQT